ncbi:hypothetical protein OT109_02380 [Phycisphaeraceae bacterium D3-23]
MRDVLPRKQADMMHWAGLFSQHLSAAPGPEAFGVTAAEAASYAALLAEAQSAYAVANDPDTRTSVAVKAKDAALARLAAQSRELVKVIKARPSVTDAQRELLGIAPRKTARKSAVARPSEAPRLTVRGVRGWTALLRLSDQAAPSRKSKPEGVSGAVVRYFVGDRPPGTLAGWEYAGTTSVTRTAFEVPGGLEPGSRVWFAASWQSPTFEPGPVSEPTMVRVGFSGLEAGAGPRPGAGEGTAGVLTLRGRGSGRLAA